MTDRLRLGPMVNPVRGFLHGAAAIAAGFGLVVLVIRTAADWPRMVSMIVFGLGLVALYATSTLYHSIPWSTPWKQRFQRLDHSMILVLVAATYTPFAFNVLTGGWRVLTLAVVWGLAAMGVAQIVAFSRVRVGLTLALALVMGWFVLVPLIELTRRLGIPALMLIGVGGLAYTVGAAVYASRRPRLWPRVFSHHELFHVLVIVGSALHFVVVLIYIVPIPRL